LFLKPSTIRVFHGYQFLLRPRDNRVSDALNNDARHDESRHAGRWIYAADVSQLSRELWLDKREILSVAMSH
jgi:hypothetical protein